MAPRSQASLADVFRSRQDAWIRHDVESLSADYAEDATLDSPMLGRVRGREAVAGTYRRLFELFPDWSLTLEEPIVDGDRVAQPFRAIATHSATFMGLPATGRRIEFRGVSICRARGGYIVEEWRVYDFTGLLLQVGVLRARST